MEEMRRGSTKVSTVACYSGAIVEIRTRCGRAKTSCVGLNSFRISMASHGEVCGAKEQSNRKSRLRRGCCCWWRREGMSHLDWQVHARNSARVPWNSPESPAGLTGLPKTVRPADGEIGCKARAEIQRGG